MGFQSRRRTIVKRRMTMATRAPFLRSRFGGYFHRDVPDNDAELTNVGPGSPGGEYLRRFWQPICFSDELHDLPRRVKILGEELVAFRNLSGTVGLLELHCPHRGTSLEFGLIDTQGIRCCYHGWLFGVDGAILETPGEPADSTLKDRLCHGAYPTHEDHGIVFAYMGPPDQQPPFPVYDALVRLGIASFQAKNTSIYATGCRSWKTQWTPPIRRFSTPSSAAPCLLTSSGCCRNWSSLRPPWG
jgi:nitrite reductase/ring-hydroxylating ferredoxin subunit